MRCPKCDRSLKDKKFKCECGHKLKFKHLPDPPKRIGNINDYEGILEVASLDKINRLIKDVEQSAGVELVLTVIGSTKPLSPENYAYFMFNRWKLGKKNSQGILILVVMQDKRIETEIGYGLEKTIREEYTEKLLDDIVLPYFRESKYGEGLLEGFKDLAREIKARLSSKESRISGD